MCVLSPSNLFEFDAKQIDTHLEIIKNMPLIIRLVDQQNRPVTLCSCVIEL